MGYCFLLEGQPMEQNPFHHLIRQFVDKQFWYHKVHHPCGTVLLKHLSCTCLRIAGQRWFGVQLICISIRSECFRMFVPNCNNASWTSLDSCSRQNSNGCKCMLKELNQGSGFSWDFPDCYVGHGYYNHFGVSLCWVSCKAPADPWSVPGGEPQSTAVALFAVLRDGKKWWYNSIFSSFLVSALVQTFQKGTRTKRTAWG